LNCAPGKKIGTADCIANRKFDNQIRSGMERHCGPGPFAAPGSFTPLQEIAAHNANAGSIRKSFFSFLQQVQVSVMKRIKLSDYAKSSHVFTPLMISICSNKAIEFLR
jgi:hypothetical protein